MSYKNQVTVLDHLRLELSKTHCAGIYGKNGSGKSTLLKIIATLAQPEKGEVLFNNHKIEPAIKKQTFNVFYMPPTEMGFFSFLTGRQNLKLWLSLYEKELSTEESIEKQFSFLDRPYQEFSSGMRQSLAFILLFYLKPELILLDEPMRNLDPENKLWICEYIKTNLKESLILVSGHQLSDSPLNCDKEFLLNDGRLIDAV